MAELGNVSRRLERDYSSLKGLSTQVQSNQVLVLGQVLVSLMEVCQILKEVNKRVVTLEGWMAAREADLKAQREEERFRKAA